MPRFSGMRANLMALVIWVLCVMPVLGLHAHDADGLDHAGHDHAGGAVQVHMALVDLCDTGLCEFEHEPHGGDLYVPLAFAKVSALSGVSDSPVLPTFALGPQPNRLLLSGYSGPPPADFHPSPHRFRLPINRAPPFASLV